jgi:formate dehydrogenase iron-sulfur subunit
MAVQVQTTPDPAATPVAVPIASPVATPAPVTTTAGQPVAATPSYASEPMGFFTDTTVCIGCKACEVACKNWNGLSATGGGVNTLSGDSYDNTRRLDGEHWRHVKFIEQFSEDRATGRWLMMSDVCKHCVHAGCLEVCPTGAIIRTEFDTVVIQSDVCNGCRDCIGACPFGVIEINPVNNTAMKCTLCYDRMQNGLTPACAQACPTASIKFGPLAELRQQAQERAQQLNDAGQTDAYLYGADDSILGGLNSFYLLVDKPDVYGLPANPQLPSKQLPAGATLSAAGAVGMGVLGLIGFRKHRMDAFAAEARAEQTEAMGESPREEAPSG